MTTSEKTRILTITSNPLVQDAVDSAFRNDADFELLDPMTVAVGVMQAVENNHPEIILLDFDYKLEETYDLVDKIATRFPGVAVIVILPESKVQFSDRVILSGARAFILYPFTQKSVQVTTRRVLELLTRNYPVTPLPEMRKQMPRPRNTYVVYSPKGGAGVSTVAVNLAIAVSQKTKEKVLLLDGKQMFGHVALMLNLRTANSITDLISHAGTLDPHLIYQVVVDHTSGIKVLPSPTMVVEGQGIRPDDLYKVVQGIQSTFPITIIDAGSFLNENTVTLMDAADKVMVVLNPNLAALRDVRQFMDITKNLSYPAEKLMFVLNQTGYKSEIRREEIESILKVKLAGSIPVDESLCLSCLNEGTPLILKSPRHPISKALQQLAGVVLKQISEANAAYNASEKQFSAEVMAKSSRLG